MKFAKLAMYGHKRADLTYADIADNTDAGASKLYCVLRAAITY